MTKNELINILRDFTRLHGASLSQQLFLNLSGLSESEIVRHFNTWNNFRIAAGLSSPGRAPNAHVTADDVLEALRDAVKKHGPRITLQRFVRETGISERLVFSRCGSWSKARLAVGLRPRANSPGPGETDRSPTKHKRKPHITAEDILDRLHHAIEKHGDNISLQRFRKETGISENTIVRRFGSWSNLRTAAGLAPHAKALPRFTREDFLADLLLVFQRTGREPMMSYHRRNGGRISAATIRNHFGSWKEAIQAFHQWHSSTCSRVNRVPPE